MMDHVKYAFGVAAFTGWFVSAWAIQWVKKRSRGDRSPIVVLVPVRGGGPRGW
jgi:hypothetical protein